MSQLEDQIKDKTFTGDLSLVENYQQAKTAEDADGNLSLLGNVTEGVENAVEGVTDAVGNTVGSIKDTIVDTVDDVKEGLVGDSQLSDNFDKAQNDFFNPVVDDSAVTGADAAGDAAGAAGDAGAAGAEISSDLPMETVNWTTI